MSKTFYVALIVLLPALLVSCASNPTPVATQTGQPDAPAAIDPATWEWECVWLTNQLRAQHDLPPLKAEPVLMDTARAHSQDMAARDYVEHTTPEGTTLLDRIQAADYNPTGHYSENIRVGRQDTPQSAIEWWYDEQPPDDWHRRNLLSVNFREFGCGIALDPDSAYQRYFTQDFGQRADVFPLIIEREAASTTQQTVALYLYGESWGATEMMLSERADLEGAAWQPFNPTATWTLSPNGGLKTIYAQIRNATSETRGPVWDTIQLVVGD